MDALSQLIPAAVGMLISPLPIVAVVAILVSPRGRAAAPAYAATFLLVVLAFVGLGALTAAGASSASSGAGRIVVLILTILLTAGFSGLAVASWVSRPQPGTEPRPPAWLAAVDTITPARAAALGFVMAITNTKNIPLALKGGALIGAAHLPPLVAALVCLALAVAASLALILPTVLAMTGARSVVRALERLKTEMIAHNAVIMTVLFAILAAVEADHLVHQLIG